MKRDQRRNSVNREDQKAEEPISFWGYVLVAISLAIAIWLPAYSVPWMLVVALIAEFHSSEDDPELEDWTGGLALTGYSLFMFGAAYAFWRWVEVDPGSLASYLYPDQDSGLPSRLVLLAWLVFFMGSIRFLRAAYSILGTRA
jgi:hypothetical protein